jgi:glycosyltransferase involved in cell wall biosynthesis
MRILYCHQHFTTPEGVVGTRSYEMARAAIAQGHQVTMVCGSYVGGKTGLEIPFRRGRRQGAVDGIEVIEFDLSYSNAQGFLRRSWIFARFALASIRLAMTARYDILFATTTPLTAGIPGIFARWLRRKTFVFEVRDLWPELPRAMGAITNPFVLGAMSVLEWLSYRSAHRCIALSPGIAEGVARRGVAPDRIAMVSNGCDLALFGEGVAERPEGVGPTDLLAIYSGTHGIANGLDAALDAAAVLKRRGRRDIKIVLIGEGREKSRLVRRAHSEGLDNVLFLDAIPKQRLTAFLAGADIGLQLLRNVPAFYFGTSPNKFFDYLAAGLPVLNNYPGWVASLISENGCGFAVAAERADLFAEALETAADDRRSLRRMGEKARALASAEFDRHRLAKRWLAWVTGERGAGTPCESGGNS